VQTDTIEYRHDDLVFDAFVARPDTDERRPAILICHAWGGRGPFEENKARALAELGYVGVAIDVYGVGKRGTDKASNQALMMPLVEDPAMLRARLSAALETTAALPYVAEERMGAIGFCFGGLCSILMARMGAPLRGTVSFHGLLKIGEKIDAKVQAKLLVLHGQDDPMVPPADVGAFAAEMKRIDADWQFHAYPGVVHAFTNPAANDPDFGTVYDAEADRRSWVEMKRFFEDVL
jgi:dienelactone hydrolase